MGYIANDSMDFFDYLYDCKLHLFTTVGNTLGNSFNCIIFLIYILVKILYNIIYDKIGELHVDNG